MKRIVTAVVAALVANGGPVAVAATPAPGAPTPAAELTSGSRLVRTHARVAYWHDGDTVRLTDGRYVRLVGIDTPELGRKKARRATRNARRIAPVHSRVTLVRIRGRDDTDDYGRLLRYVQRDGVDIGASQLRKGLAVPAYDSGAYQSHPRRAEYHRIAARSDRHAHGSAVPARWRDRPWDAAPYSVPDLDCADLRHQVRLHGSNWMRLDSDGDGIGCDSYPGPPW